MDNKTKKQKIFYVITKGNFGGAQKYVFELASSMKDYFDITVIMGEGDILASKLKNENIKIIKIDELGRDVNVFKEIKVLIKLVQIFKQHKPDIVHLNSSKIGGLGSFAARIAGVKKIIFTAHGWAFNESRGALSKLVIKFLSWLTIIFCHKIIAVSEKDKQDGIKMLFAKRKILTIKNGIVDHQLLPKEEARKKLFNESPAENSIWIGTIAELHKNKGLSYAIEAMALIKDMFDIKYFIIGAGEEKSNLESIIRNKNLEKRVFILGQIEKASRYIKAFDIFILPSIKEGLSYVLLEAGLAEVPVMSTIVGGTPEIIDDGETGYLVQPASAQSIKESIMRILSNKEKSERLAHNLRNKVLKNFSFDQMIRETMAVYKN